MMTIKCYIILTTLFCFWGFQVRAQELNLFLQDIEEVRFNGETRRSGSDSVSKITFTTAINGIPLDNYHFVKLQKLKVTDDTGKILSEIKGTFYKNDTYSNDKRMELTTVSPHRHATKIKRIEGSLQYFTPTQANKGRIIIRDFLDRKDENLLHQTYPDVVLKIMDTDKLVDMEGALQKIMNKEIEKRKKEGPISDEEQDEITQARKLLGDIMKLNANNSAQATLTFQLNRDLKDIFHRFAIMNENNEKIDTGYFAVDNIYQFYLSEQPTEACYIEILIETKEAVKELPFLFSDILLP